MTVVALISQIFMDSSRRQAKEKLMEQLEETVPQLTLTNNRQNTDPKNQKIPEDD